MLVRNSASIQRCFLERAWKGAKEWQCVRPKALNSLYQKHKSLYFGWLTSSRINPTKWMFPVSGMSLFPTRTYIFYFRFGTLKDGFKMKFVLSKKKMRKLLTSVIIKCFWKERVNFFRVEAFCFVLSFLGGYVWTLAEFPEVNRLILTKTKYLERKKTSKHMNVCLLNLQVALSI